MIQSEYNREEYITTAGQTVYPYTFKIVNKDDMIVKLGATTLVVDSDYTVSGVGNEAGGNVTLAVAPAPGVSLVILRQVALTQLVDYVEHDKFPAEVHEGALDKLTMAVQQLEEKFNRSIQFPIEATYKDINVPSVMTPGYFLQVNGSGNGFVVSPGAPTATIHYPDGTPMTEVPYYEPKAYASINAAVLAIGATKATLTISTEQTLTANLTIPSNISIVVMEGGSFKKASTYTLTINGPFDAGRYQVFSGFDAGDVKFGRGYITGTFPEWWGATNDTIAKAWAALGTNPGRVLLGLNSYTMGASITSVNHHQGIEGQRSFLSDVLFTGSGAAFTYDLGSNALVGPFAKHFTLRGTDNTNLKQAFVTMGTEEWECEDVVVTDWHDATNSCEGYRSHGKHMSTLKHVTINADIPVRLRANAYWPSIDADHYHWEDVYFIAHPSHYMIEVDSGLAVYNFTVDGRQAHCVGKGIIYVNDTTSSYTSNNWLFENIRLEQETDATAPAFYIKPNLALYGLTIRNVYCGATGRGVYVDKVANVQLDTFNYMGTGRSLETTSNTNGVEWHNCFWQSGSTALLTGQVPIFNEVTRTGAALGASGKLANATWPGNIETKSYISAPTITVAAGATAEFCPEQVTGVWAIVNDANETAVFSTMGPGHLAAEMLDPWTTFSHTKDTADHTNIYWDAGNSRYTLQNSRAISIKYRLICLGTNYF